MGPDGRMGGSRSYPVTMSEQAVQQQPDPEFAANAISQVFELWVNSELERRGVQLTRADIRKVVVEMRPDQAPEVLINDEATIESHATVRQTFQAGEPVMLDDIEQLDSLEPATVGADSGWICFARIGGNEYFAFDLRYNKARASALLDRAREFLESAQHAGERAINVAIDNAHSAAELAVQAQMLLQQHETSSHRERREWLAEWAKLRNSPQQHADTLWNLAELRTGARYGSASVRLKQGRLRGIFTVVQQMIDNAAARAAVRTTDGAGSS